MRSGPGVVDAATDRAPPAAVHLLTRSRVAAEASPTGLNLKGARQRRAGVLAARSGLRWPPAPSAHGRATG